MEKGDFMMTNREGRRMPATLRTPDGRVRGTMMLFHGLGGSQMQKDLIAVGDAALCAGYQVFTLDAANGVVAPDSNFQNHTMSNYLLDVEDSIQWLKESGKYQPPLVLTGRCMGGTIPLILAQKYPEDVSKVILIATFVSWKSGLWMYWPSALWWMLFDNHKTTAPTGEKKHLSRRSLFDYFKFDGYAIAPQLSIPILIISAGKDETVAKPFEHRIFAKRFKNARQVTVPKARHSMEGHEQEVAGIVTEWLT